MSDQPIKSKSGPQETDLLVKFEIDNIPTEYREYYATKRNNFFASIQGFREMWGLLHPTRQNLDARIL